MDPETEQSPAMVRFETVLNFTLDARDKSPEDIKAEVLKAADRLLEDSAMEMADSTINAFLALLMHIYQTGQIPGASPNAILNQLSEVLAEAGRKKHADNTTHDSY